jgi:hypothetical protein
MVGRIATEEIEEPTGKAPNRAKGGRKGAKGSGKGAVSSRAIRYR